MLSTIAFLFVLGVLVFVHEFGHFIFAKIFKVRVETFSLGFGKKLFRIKKGETEYCLSAFPLGGYVKLSGEQPGENEGKSWELLSKSPGQRAAIVFAGPLFNYLIAFLLFSYIFFTGMPTPTARVGEVKDAYPAFQAGIQKNDRIISIDGKKVEFWHEVSEVIHAKTDSVPVRFEIERDGQTLNLELVPKVEKINNLFGDTIEIGLAGIANSEETKIMRYGFFQSFGMGANQVYNLTKMTYFAIYRMVIGKMSFRESFGGPVLIFQYTGAAAREGMSYLLQLMAALSVSLAIINLFPFPVLDGGHLFFILIEKIKGSPLSLKTMEAANRVGMYMLIALTVFVFYNDLMRIGFFEKIFDLFSGK